MIGRKTRFIILIIIFGCGCSQDIKSTADSSNTAYNATATTESESLLLNTCKEVAHIVISYNEGELTDREVIQKLDEYTRCLKDLAVLYDSPENKELLQDTVDMMKSVVENTDKSVELARKILNRA